MNVDTDQARLLAAALDGAHAGYFAGLPAVMVEQAKASSVGRRVLLRSLLTRAGSLQTEVFSLPANLLRDRPWVLWDDTRLHTSAADLGAIALAPCLRTRVDRTSVLRLRSALGSTRLSMALAFDSGMSTPKPEWKKASNGLAAALDKVESIAALVARTGFRELLGYAWRLHPAVGERVRLAFNPDWRTTSSGIWLPDEAIGRYFDGRMDPQSSESAEDEQKQEANMSDEEVFA